MNAEIFNELVKNTKIGKKLPDAIYLHKDSLDRIDLTLKQFITAVGQALKIDGDNWNIIKLSRQDFRLSLLSYPSFFTESYPALTQSVTVDLSKLSHRVVEYNATENPPILHRKETMLYPEHPNYEEFQLITQEGESAGLYDNSRMIGYKQSWERLIEKHGYELIDGRLFRASSTITKDDNQPSIDRHKTAIVRHELSAPMKQLAKQGFLNGDYTIFDYGCGRGDDLTELQAHGLEAIGWDPNFKPEAEKVNSDLVNIGFVINVIEDQVERSEALLGAWHLTNKLLVVSAMLANDNYIAQFTPYKDGVITSRNTFQKYYAQAELKGYIERTLDENAITIAPGIFYVFKDKIEEQRFLSNRFKRHHTWQQLSSPEPTGEQQAKLLFVQHQELLKQFWETCLELGRLPVQDEFSLHEQIVTALGNSKKALKLMLQVQGERAKAEFETAIEMRREDLLVYFALCQFEQHKGYQHLPEELKRDIKVFFDTYKTALAEAKTLLYRIANTDEIEQACIEAHETLPASKLNSGHSLELHKKFLPQLPALLRVYVGAAIQLYGDLEEIDLIKIHITSGKVSFMGYDNFDTCPLPTLRERIKVKMWELDVDFFDYVDVEKRPPLLYKSQYQDESFGDYKKQRAFDKRMKKEDIFKFSETPNNLKEVYSSLNQNKLECRGYRVFTI
ncbi:DNA phosphorothioation-associated putative methyltransferase [Shewanella sp. Isolate13]|uniref:DNA phosphorothioation-associated putative methyltransferase n=1 Tax=Shewanella sp. Isolate13 TaxID=2908531 RepID=UPI001EFCD37B|nr:DNA phosphorothioation-associated putative methyltransferase [Shewanella sp. Isolate13]MCG9730817.1 DNA phosphorothioation-associated putative methyltransferase [Shewanella sp. Isolate13]